MNFGGTPRHRSWGHVFTSQLVEEEQTIAGALERNPTALLNGWQKVELAWV
jgi:hypothetical protein